MAVRDLFAAVARPPAPPPGRPDGDELPGPLG
jgi:hypothetical protein